MTDYSLLIVDDDEELLQSLTSWFSRLGFQVTTAHHPRLALVAAAYRQFDAAVIDITLPEMNGLELIDQLNSLADTPITVLSGDGNPQLKKAALDLGVYRFILKPVGLRAIEECVRDSIREAPTAQYSHKNLTLNPAS